MENEARGVKEEKDAYANKKEVTAEEMHARSEELKRQKQDLKTMEQRLLELFRDARRHFAALPHKKDTGEPDPAAGRDADSTLPENQHKPPALTEKGEAEGDANGALVAVGGDDNSTIASKQSTVASSSAASSSSSSAASSSS